MTTSIDLTHCKHEYERGSVFSDSKIYWFRCSKCGRKWRISVPEPNHYQIKEF